MSERPGNALQVPTHMYHYTPHSLEKVLEAGGWSIEKIYSIDLEYLKENPTFAYKNIIYGFSIVFKNTIYWLFNINLIFISTKIFFRSLVRLPINKG